MKKPYNISDLIAQIVELERLARNAGECTCGEVSATLQVNYGRNGRAVPGLIPDEISNVKALILICEHYENRVSNMSDLMKDMETEIRALKKEQGA